MTQHFFLLCAWVLCIGFGLFSLLRIVCYFAYNSKSNEFHKMMDMYHGKHIVFPLQIPGTVFVVSLLYLIANYTY